MIKVVPIQTKSEQELACSRCKITFKPDTLAYSASVDDEFVGMCQFKLTDKGGVVYDLAVMPERDSFEAMFVMGRAALNFIDLCGVHTAFYNNESSCDDTLLRAIGFSKNSDGIYEMDLTDFFTSHPCKHCKDGMNYDSPKQ